MSKEEKTILKGSDVTQEMIDAWKKQYGDIFRVKVEDKTCYLKVPTRKTLSYATQASKTNPLKFNEIIIDGCWLGGDEDFKTNDSYFLALSSKLDEIIEVKEVELEKL